MEKFIDIGKYHVNADYVVTVTKPVNGTESFWIEMSNGQQIEVESAYYKKLISHSA